MLIFETEVKRQLKWNWHFWRKFLKWTLMEQKWLLLK